MTGRPFFRGFLNILFEDKFNYSGSLDGSKWPIIFRSPNVNGDEAEFSPYTTEYEYAASALLDLVDKFTFYFEGVIMEVNSAEGRTAVVKYNGTTRDGNNQIIIIGKTTEVRFVTRQGAVSEITSFPNPGRARFKITYDWTASRIQLYINDVLIATHTIRIPYGPFRLEPRGMRTGVSHDVVFDYHLVVEG